MPRKQRNRKLHSPPKLKGLKPIGIPMRYLEKIILHYDEYEAIRLADYENLKQEQAAIKMNISRPTFTRIYNKARKKIAKALIEIKPIIIEGGNVEFDKQWYRCNDCNNVYEKTENEDCPNCNSANNEDINKNIENWKNKQMK